MRRETTDRFESDENELIQSALLVRPYDLNRGVGLVEDLGSEIVQIKDWIRSIWPNGVVSSGRAAPHIIGGLHGTS